MAENFESLDDRKTFDWKGIKLTYTIHPGRKKNPMIILIGGWTSAPRYWDRNLEYFQSKGTVAVLDLVGHYPGDISENISRLDFNLFLESQSQAILKISENRKPVLVGHSTGGMAVLGVAALYPDKISKVIAIAPVVYGPVVGLFKTAVLLHRIRLGFLFEIGLFATQMSAEFMKQGFARGVRKPEQFFKKPGMTEYLDTYFPYFKRLSGRNMNMILDMLDRADLRPLMLNYKVPTLLIRSLNDPIVPAWNAAHLAKDHSCIQEVLFNESGHFIHLEEQEEFERVVSNFLASSK